MQEETRPFASTPSSPRSDRGRRDAPISEKAGDSTSSFGSFNNSPERDSRQISQLHSRTPPLSSLSDSPSTNLSFSPRTPASSSTRDDFLAEDSPSPPPTFEHLPSPTPSSGNAVSKTLTKAASVATIIPSSNTATSPPQEEQDPDVPEPNPADLIAKEIAGAELIIAADGTFIETTSAHAARELKRQYDQQLGVGKKGLRSPYAIIVAQDAQGRQVFRVSSHPSPAQGERSSLIISDSNGNRRPRLSVGGLLPPGLFKQNGINPTGAPPASTQHNKPPGPKKPAKLLRSTRSNSEFRGVPSGNAPRVPRGSVSSAYAFDDSSYPGRAQTSLLSTTLDVFSNIIGWSEQDGLSVSSSSRPSPDFSPSWASSDDEFPYSAFTRKNKTSVRPFGDGVSYTVPSRPLDVSIRPPQVRLMQSFESGLTARADDLDRSTPTESRPHTTLSHTHTSASPFTTEIFEVLQTYRGIPLANTLSALATDKTFKLSSSVSAAPKDDPRFVIWGEVQGIFEMDDDGTSQSDLSSTVSSRNRKGDRVRRGSTMTDSSQSTGNGVAGLPLGKKVIAAATIERWIAQLTSELDYTDLWEFFLTYRVYISGIDLCQLLICRFHWALEPAKNKQEETVKRIVRVRTFIAFRFWLTTFFKYDFLPNRELCSLLTGWLNSLKADEGINGSGENKDVLDIVRKLKRVVRECKASWVRHSIHSMASTADSSSSAPLGSPRAAPSTGSSAGGHAGSLAAEVDDSDVDLDLGDAALPPSPSLDLSLDLPEAPSAKPFIAKDHSVVAHHSRRVSSPFPSTRSDAASIVSSVIVAPYNAPQSSIPVSQFQPRHGSIIAQPVASGVHRNGVGSPPLTTPLQHSALSRAFVNTMGRLGRWKRVLHMKSSNSGTIGAHHHPSNSVIVGGGLAGASRARPSFDIQDAVLSESLTRGASATVSPLHGGTGSGVVAIRGGVERYMTSGSGFISSELNNFDATSSSHLTTGTINRQPAVGEAKKESKADEQVTDSYPRPPSFDKVPLPPSPPVLPTTAPFLPPIIQVDNDAESPRAPPGLDIPPHLLASPPYSETRDSTAEASMLDPSVPVSPEVNRVSLSSTINDVSSTSTKVTQVVDGPSDDTTTEDSSSMLEKTEVFINDIPNPELIERDAITPVNYTEVVDSSNPITAGQQALDKRLSDLSWAEPAHQDQADETSDAMTAADEDDARSRVESEYGDDFDDYNHRRPEIVSLDDFELSDSGSDADSDRGGRLRRPQRRLPTRRDFEFVRWSRGTVSSLGIRSADAHSSIASSSSDAPPVIELGEIKDWQVAMITESDEDEPGGQEDALRRLEGQIDANKQKVKDKKVDKWMKAVARRLAAGEGIDFNDLDDDHSDSDDEGRHVSSGSHDLPAVAEALEDLSHIEELSGSSRGVDYREADAILQASGEQAPKVVIEKGEVFGEELEDGYPISEEAREALGGATPTPDAHVDGIVPTPRRLIGEHGFNPPPPPRPSLEQPTVPADPMSKAEKRKAATSSLTRKASYIKTLSMQPRTKTMPTVHCSFIFMHRSETLAQHFAMIERDMFLAIQHDEIVSGKWSRFEHREVLDWAQYIKEKGKIKTEARERKAEPNVSMIFDLRARFNLMVGFIASEIVLTNPSERPALVAKIIRVAWKAYMQNNFATVVSMITALRTFPVNLALGKNWNRVGSWETRVYEDLQEFASWADNFKMIRKATAALVESSPTSADSTGPRSVLVGGSSVKSKQSDNKGGTNKGCVPFFGMYLYELEHYVKLPDYIDPTSPTTPVKIDKVTGALSPPSHPEVFSALAPLPSSIPLEPLINVHKQRLNARVIQSIVAGQHLASSVSFNVDRKLYQKCLRLKSLDVETLIQVASTYSNEP